MQRMKYLQNAKITVNVFLTQVTLHSTFVLAHSV